MFKRSIRLLAAAGLAVGLVAPSFAATEQTPQQIVQSIADQLSEAVQGHQGQLKQDPAEITAIINRIVLPNFDTNYASLLVLGQYARQATPAQRAAFTQAFYKALVQRYGEGLLSYTRGAVTVLPTRGALDQNRTLVRTEVKLSNGNPISVDYAFRKTSTGQWKAYDVIIAGISYITNYRSQVASEIQKEGIDGLIKRLQTEGSNAVQPVQLPQQGT